MDKTVYEVKTRSFSVGSAFELSTKMSSFLPIEYNEVILKCLSQINPKYFKNPIVKFTISNESIVAEKQLMRLYSSCSKNQPYIKYIIDKFNSELYIWTFTEKNINYILIVVHLNKDILGIKY